MQKYRTFTRSCRNWTEFANANKRTVRTDLTIEEAREMCKEFNDNRNSVQIRKGTKMEFTAE